MTGFERALADDGIDSWVSRFNWQEPITWGQLSTWGKSLPRDYVIGFAGDPLECPVVEAIRSIYNMPIRLVVSMGMKFHDDCDTYVLRIRQWGELYATPYISIAITDMDVISFMQCVDQQGYKAHISSNLLKDMIDARSSI